MRWSWRRFSKDVGCLFTFFVKRHPTSFFLALLAAHLAAQTPQFKSNVDLVEVDVTVVDKDGKPVTDLTAADFEIRERGDVQHIDTIYLVSPDAKPVAGVTPAPPAGALPVASGAPVPTRPLPPRVFVFVFDMAHLSGSGYERSKNAVRSFLNDGLRPADFAGIVVNGNMLGNRLVSDKTALLAQLDTMGLPNLSRFNEMRQWPRILSEEEASQISANNETVRDAAVQRACNERPGDCAGLARYGVESDVENKSREITSNALRDGQTTLTVLLTLANGLGRFPGTKQVVLFSEGFFTGDFAERVTQVSGLAARNRVRMSTLDARGLNTDPRQQDFLGESPTVSTSDLVVLGNDTNADVLATLALETGGERIRNRNNLRPALDRIADESSTYYMIGYVPIKPFDGSYRSIDVKVRRPGVRVIARRGYLATHVPDKEPPPQPVPQTDARTPALTPPAVAPGAAPASVAPGTAGPAPAAPGAPGTAGPPSVPSAPSVSSAIRLRPAGNPDTATLGNRIARPGTPEQAGLLAREGWNLYAAGKVEEARDKLAAASAGGAGVWTDYALALAEFTLSHPEEAARIWQRVRTAQPDYEPVYFDLADAYLQMGRSSDALSVLRDAARRWPSDSETHNAVGVVLISRGALDDAIDSFSKATTVAPNDGLGFFNLARGHHLRYQQRLRATGTSATAARALGENDRQKAIAAYKTCLTLGGSFEKDARDALALLEWR